MAQPAAVRITGCTSPCLWHHRTERSLNPQVARALSKRAGKCKREDSSIQLSLAPQLERRVQANRGTTSSGLNIASWDRAFGQDAGQRPRSIARHDPIRRLPRGRTNRQPAASVPDQASQDRGRSSSQTSRWTWNGGVRCSISLRTENDFVPIDLQPLTEAEKDWPEIALLDADYPEEVLEPVGSSVLSHPHPILHKPR